MRARHYWRDGTVAVDPRLPAGSEEWKRQMDIYMRRWSDPAYKILAKTAIAGGREVSTVWLGVDHNFGVGPPLIFESLVFPGCEDLRRYATEAEALAGHAELVAEWSAKAVVH